MKKKRLILAGIGHVNIGVLARAEELVDEGYEVVAIHPEPVQYYSGMGPGMLGRSYEPEEIRFPVEYLTRRSGSDYLRQRVVRVDAPRQELTLTGGERLSFDVLSLNLGSATAERFEIAGEQGDRPSLYTSKPVSALLELRQEIERRKRSESLRVVVAGGGPAAVEIAANCARLLGADSRTKHWRVKIVSRTGVLPGFPPRAAAMATRELERLGVGVHTGQRVTRIVAGGVEAADEFHAAHIVVAATGVTPRKPAAADTLPVGRDGGLAVNENLNILGYPNIFAAGDCIDFGPRPLARVGVHAVRETPVIVNNVCAMLRGRPELIERFEPQRSYLLLINLGGERALFWRKVLGLDLVLAGRWLWRLKDRIDRSFMREYGSERDWQQAHTTS